MPNGFFSDAPGSIAGRWGAFISRHPLLPVLAGSLAGIVIGDSLAIQPLWFGAATLLIGAVALTGKRFPGNLVLLAALAFAFAQSVAVWKIRQFPFHENLQAGESIRLTGVGRVISDPSRLGSGNLQRCLVEFERFILAGRNWSAAGHVLPVTLENPPSDLEYGHRVRLNGLLSPLEGSRSPGAFAPDAFYYRSAGATGEISDANVSETLDRTAGSPLIAIAHRSREWIESAVSRGLGTDPETASVIKAMVLGSREDTPEHIEEQFRLSGAMHVFTVSGLHVGIFGAILWGILRWFRVPKRWAIFVIIPTILAYALITGLRPSAVRAAIMGAVLLTGFLAERPPRLLNSLAFAALVILAFNPQQLFLPGFQLSFSVLASIALFADPVRQFFQHRFAIDPLIPRQVVPRWRRWIDTAARSLSAGLGVSIAAWAGSMILIAQYFQLVTPVAVVANLFMVPLAFIILGLAAVSVMMSGIGLTFLGTFLNQANATFAQLSTFTATAFASVPGGHFHVSPAVFAKLGECQITVLEPNPSGMATLLSVRPTPFRSAHWLIDPGNGVGFNGSVQPLLRHYAVNRLQSIVISHGDHQHISAAGLAFSRLPTGALLESPLPNAAFSYKSIIADLERTRTRRQPVVRGERSLVGNSDTLVEVLFPPRDYQPQPNSDDQCLVLRIHHRNWRVLLTFDSGFLTEKWLLENHEDLQSDVWIKGWHAQDISGLTEFLDRVGPRAILTTNRRFPAHQRIPESFRKVTAERDITLFDLTESGSVTIDFAPETLTLTPFKKGEPVEIRRP